MTPAKTKKAWKKAPEQGLSRNDTKIFNEFNKQAYSLDNCFTICGIKLGWSAVLGVIPFLGDLINVFYSIRLIQLAYSVDGGLPWQQLAQMVGNVVLDFVLGLIPFMGIISAALYRANSRNALILQHFLKKRAANNVGNGLFIDDQAGFEMSSTGESRSANGRLEEVMRLQQRQKDNEAQFRAQNNNLVHDERGTADL